MAKYFPKFSELTDEEKTAITEISSIILGIASQYQDQKAAMKAKYKDLYDRSENFRKLVQRFDDLESPVLDAAGNLKESIERYLKT
jgi:soluble cytochrome b562